MNRQLLANAEVLPAPETIDVSVLIPIYNEAENLPILLDQVFRIMEGLGLSYEVIAVNDGSSDGSMEVLQRFAASEPRFKVVDFRRNYGQTAAMMAAIDYARGNVLVSLDADLQNDAQDIPQLLAKLGEGYDVVSGWRQERKDKAIRRNLVSRIANAVISIISGVHLHDYGCTLKVYRRNVLENVRLYGEMHRFIPIYARWQGGRITELPVRHHPRRFGHSKYGLERVLKVVLDLIVVTFLHRFMEKPIYVFGGFGLLSLAMSGVAFAIMVYLRLVYDISMILTPLPMLTAMTLLIGVISILMGLLAEILVRTYFESQGKLPYSVRNTVNFDPSA
jgi:glycosyltransferase involved in cell wall biosynthesis